MVPAFWGKALDININAKALLAVAELLASRDSRNKEVAERINEQYLHLKTLPEPRVWHNPANLTPNLA
ncbi:type IV toxin-antitoxin system AbiEi family antitoxin [Salinivibrio kushneri]|uniref:type IV toxin-antitoxin system AbiEi family antitoxin n=1 Tax=Salinivibrio kushneri TaxID=1908198 RepID=UPI001CA4AE6B